MLQRPRVVFEDPDLPHQIVLRFTGGNTEHPDGLESETAATEGGAS